jgi:hypothetical protein
MSEATADTLVEQWRAQAPPEMLAAVERQAELIVDATMLSPEGSEEKLIAWVESDAFATTLGIRREEVPAVRLVVFDTIRRALTRRRQQMQLLRSQPVGHG